MLVLTRKYQEKIRIGDNITITVLRAKGKAVRLGIEAPADVPVIRGELSFERNSQQKREPVSTVAFGDGESPKRNACVGGKATGRQWVADSRPNAVGFTTVRESEPKVELSRVPRNKVAGMLPKFVSGNAPLRAMMDNGFDR